MDIFMDLVEKSCEKILEESRGIPFRVNCSEPVLSIWVYNFSASNWRNCLKYVTRCSSSVTPARARRRCGKLWSKLTPTWKPNPWPWISIRKLWPTMNCSVSSIRPHESGRTVSDWGNAFLKKQNFEPHPRINVPVKLVNRVSGFYMSVCAYDIRGKRKNYIV